MSVVENTRVIGGGYTCQWWRIHVSLAEATHVSGGGYAYQRLKIHMSPSDGIYVSVGENTCQRKYLLILLSKLRKTSFFKLRGYDAGGIAGVIDIEHVPGSW